jgi:hypothetical protein
LDNETVTGLDALNEVLMQFGQKALDEAANLLEARGEMIMGDSKQNYVPVDQSTLQGTGHVEKPVIAGENVSVRLAYGGPGTAYAEAIHEHLSVHSPRSWKIAEVGGAHTVFGRLVGSGVHFKQGGPKYLELPFIKGTADLAQWVADGLRNKLGM